MADELPPQLEFLQYHLPSLPPGDYTLKVGQTIDRIKNGGPLTSNAFAAQLTFTVASERLALKPTDIQAVFPPEGSLLDHSNILPHIVLKRSTLPWERQADASDPESPWLALLLLEDGEAFTQSTVKLSEINHKIPGFSLAPGEDESDSVVVLDLPATSPALTYLPTGDELKLLTHVRRGKDAAGALGDELAVVVGNRLPAKGVRSTVHLVALEARYQQNGQGTATFNRGTGAVRLVSLKSWSFACLRTYLLTAEALAGLKPTMPPADLALLQPLQDVEVTGQDAFLAAAQKQLGQEVPATYRDALLQAAEWKKTFHSLLHQLDQGMLCLPARPAAAELLGAGFVPLPHQFRDGEQLVSWYHGPLVPGQSATASPPVPIRAADALLRYYPATGLLDVSYAAAWELGRLLGLSSKSFSVKLYNWKRSVTQQLMQSQQPDAHTYPLSDAAAAWAMPPAEVSQWFTDAGLLANVPLNYLVPDERLVPVESIRFFQLDPFWMDCLFDGAFSIGRVIQRDVTVEQELAQQFRFPYRSRGLSGVLIRSELVAGWPDLFVEGYTTSTTDSPQQPIRRSQLAKNLLLCLFEGDLQALDIHLKPEAMHFGLDESDTVAGDYYKVLRKADGSVEPKQLNQLPWRDKEQRVMDVASLASQMQHAENQVGTPNSAWFALEMIESSVKARFSCTST